MYGEGTYATVHSQRSEDYFVELYVSTFMRVLWIELRSLGLCNLILVAAFIH